MVNASTLASGAQATPRSGVALRAPWRSHPRPPSPGVGGAVALLPKYRGCRILRSQRLGTPISNARRGPLGDPASLLSLPIGVGTLGIPPDAGLWPSLRSIPTGGKGIFAGNVPRRFPKDSHAGSRPPWSAELATPSRKKEGMLFGPNSRTRCPLRDLPRLGPRLSRVAPARSIEDDSNVQYSCREVEWPSTSTR
jgi:hypothetical protein